MNKIVRVGKQVWRGLPYLRKELARPISLQTGWVLATPLSYYVIFSGRCNFECAFCTIHKEKDPTLTEEAMLRVVKEATALSGSGFNISVSGGEPLIYKPIYPALELAHRLGVNLGLTTNGYSLTKPNVRRILQFDPFNINVSLESVDPKINESVRLKLNGTQRALEGIENVVEEKRRVGSRVSVVVKPTIMEQTYRTLPQLVRYFKRYPEVQINFQPFSGLLNDPFWIRDVDDFAQVAHELSALKRQGHAIIGDDHTMEGFVDYFRKPIVSDRQKFLDLKGAKRGCDIGYRSLFVFPNGDVHFCDWLKRPIGNLYKQSLSEIYYGEAAQALRRRIDYCTIDCQSSCQRAVPLFTKAKAFLRMG